jgi:hypothetical protein
MTLATRVRAMERLSAGDDDWCRCSPGITICMMVVLKVVYDDVPTTVGWERTELIDSESARNV